MVGGFGLVQSFDIVSHLYLHAACMHARITHTHTHTLHVAGLSL